MLRGLRWYWAKRRLARPGRLVRPAAVSEFRYERHTFCLEDFPPNTDAYGQLADLWDAYSAWFVPRYGTFLAAAGRYYGVPVRSVLDLACGTGLLTRQVAKRAESVVGLDVNDAMLAQARLRTSASNVRYLHGDFRSFSLGETFDVILCGSNSLNYVQTRAELVDVFACVQRHLRPGGLFVFDTVDDRYCHQVTGLRTVAVVDGQRFEVYTFYDPQTRVSESRLVMGKSVERHRRIPIAAGDVGKAVAGSGLTLTEHFSANTFRWRELPQVGQFFVLRLTKPASRER